VLVLPKFGPHDSFACMYYSTAPTRNPEWPGWKRGRERTPGGPGAVSQSQAGEAVCKVPRSVGSGEVMADGFVCLLFVLFSFYVLHPEGVCGLLQKKPAAAPAYKPQQKKSPAPSVRCAHFSGYGSPLQINERSKETKKGKRS
jgi:hypothetical protein